jgi:hypothetical protein
MKKKFIVLIAALCCVGVGFAQQEVPKGLNKAIQLYLSDGLFKSDLKILLSDTKTQLSDVVVDVPIPYYIFKGQERSRDFIDSINIEDSVMSLIKPTGIWLVSFSARGAYLFSAEFARNNGVFKRGQATVKTAWAEVRAAYPQGSGINPIIIQEDYDVNYLHFPDINPNNLTLMTNDESRKFLKKEWRSLKSMKEKKNQLVDEFQESDGRLSTTTSSYKYLVDSRTTLRFLKEQNKRRKSNLSKRVSP